MMSYHSGCWNLSLQQNEDLTQLKLLEVYIYSVNIDVKVLLRYERVRKQRDHKTSNVLVS